MTFKDDHLIFKCFEFKKNYKKNFCTKKRKDLQVHMNFVIKIVINYFGAKKKISMNIWIAG